jgi:hypothetical protein
MVGSCILWFVLLFLAIFDRCGESGPGLKVLRSTVRKFLLALPASKMGL